MTTNFVFDPNRKRPRISAKGTVNLLICLPATLEQEIDERWRSSGAISRNEFLRNVLHDFIHGNSHEAQGQQ